MPETAASPAAEVHHPATVGSTFMRQYYHFLAKEPESLHRFYKEESQWCHGVGSHMQEPIAGQKAINDEILRRGYAGARVDLDSGSIDCQGSLNGGVFVLVTGVMTLASSHVPKPFVQTFFLAVQPKGYFVLNDCLRFLELPGASSAPSATDAAVAPKDVKKTTHAAIGTPVSASPKPKAVTPVAVAKKDKAAVSPATKPVEAPKSPVKAAKSPEKKPATPKAAPAPASPVKAEKKVSTPKPSETKPASPAPAPAKPVEAAAPAPAQAKPATPAQPVVQKHAEPAAPKTWAALFNSTQAVAALASTAAAPAKATQPAAPKATPAPASPKAKPAETPSSNATAQSKEKPRYFSLYIRDVPPQTKESELRDLFKSYGAIANVTVPQGRGYAFVDYVDQESMRAALADEKEFKVHDKVLQVDERTERKDKERGSFRADTRGRGRGGPKGRTGERKEREADGKDRRAAGEREGNNNANGRSNTNGPRSNNDRREKGGRRGGKDEGAGRGANRTE
ncbi:hypothetical protein Poli38472_002188 [Pythium oligandrum]|uniref:Uncharacterized protein n=1 Tax=Pythium oligandrum TaxID=41045 RepID=A0A8K1CH29_PYTOL|nr:hypothetical protein Poli38472_002188 [Pythium oligandrum]|eukprot:TMW63247.1 hypothetical protein Poli38472_002188 [Pythium oligandrum]